METRFRHVDHLVLLLLLLQGCAADEVAAALVSCTFLDLGDRHSL
jgi:hypothetical protein